MKFAPLILTASFWITSSAFSADFKCNVQGDFLGEKFSIDAAMTGKKVDLSLTTVDGTETDSVELPNFRSLTSADTDFYPMFLTILSNNLPPNSGIIIFDPLTAAESALVKRIDVKSELAIVDPEESPGSFWFAEAFDAKGGMLARFFVLSDLPLLGRCK